MGKQSDVSTKNKIINLIIENPGLHTSKIAQLLDISWELAYYHLTELEKNELVKIIKVDGFSRVFVNGNLGMRDREIISFLRKKTSLKIILFLLSNPYSTFTDMDKNIKISASTLSYHLEKLVDKKIIEIQYDNKSRKNYFVINRKHIIDFLVKYKPYSFIENYKKEYIKFLMGGDLFE